MTKVQMQNNAGDTIWNIEIEPGKNLLSQLESQDVEIPNACRTGMCGACLCMIQKWHEHVIKNMRWEPAFPLWEDEVMTCIAGLSDAREEVVLQTLSD